MFHSRQARYRIITQNDNKNVYYIESRFSFHPIPIHRERRIKVAYQYLIFQEKRIFIHEFELARNTLRAGERSTWKPRRMLFVVHFSWPWGREINIYGWDGADFEVYRGE